MYELLANLWLGFGVAATPTNIMLCMIGALVGTLIGVLPGIGSLATIAMLLPITFGLPPVGALIMLAGIYYGAQYGGSTTSILVNIPGESSSVITTLDGHQMARQGRAGPALAIAAIGSFFAGCVATVLVAALGAPLTAMALLFGPAEYFSLMVLGLIFAVVLAKGSVLKALTMILMGLLLSMIGSDLETGAERMTFGIPELSDGIGFVVVGMGVFGFGEILRNLEMTGTRDIVQGKITGLMPTLPDLKASAGAIGRGTIIGSVLGILPGGGAVIASFAAYTFEKRISKHPERFGRGAIEGVAAPESANNAAAQTSFIPLLTLGIPPNPGDGADGRRHDHPRHRAGPAGHDQAARAVLGHDRLDVDRQPDADRHQPAAGRHVGAPAARAVPPAVPDDRDLLRDRHLLDQQRAVRRHHDGDLRAGRLLAGQARLRAGADDPRLRARPADGGKPAPRHADRARRRHGVPDAADLGGAARDLAAHAGARGAADDSRKKREEVFTE